QLIGVEHVENRYLVPLKAEVLQATQQAAHVVEAIGNQEDQAAAANLLGQLVDERTDRGLLLRFRACQRLEDYLNMAGLAARRQLRTPRRVEYSERSTVTLVDDLVSQTCGQQLGIFQLVGCPVAVKHRPAGIEQDVADEVGFLLVLLD